MVPVSRRVLAIATLTPFFGLMAFAQSVISTHSGVLHMSEGSVFMNDQAVNQKYGTFPDVKEKSVLRTDRGRAEILLTPGVFLRIGENSSVKMIDNRLSDTRVELVKGTAVVECDDPMKENSVTMVFGEYQVHVRKSSVMELSADPAVLKVIHGEAEVELNGAVAVVKSGKMMPFTQALAQERFDAKNQADELTRWSEERSQAVSVANVSAAKTLRDSGGMMGNGMLANGMVPYGSWYYNPYYSMYTYMPMNGMLFNPYGFGFFSPYTVYQVYNPGYYYYPGNNGGGGASSGTPTSSANRQRLGYTSIGSQRPTYASAGRPGTTSNGLAPLSAAAPNYSQTGYSSAPSNSSLSSSMSAPSATHSTVSTSGGSTHPSRGK